MARTSSLQLRRMAKELNIGLERKGGLFEVVGHKPLNDVIANEFKEDLKENIEHALFSALTWATGRQENPSEAVGKIYTRGTSNGVQVLWTGHRIEFIEYGAGIEAVGKYKGEMDTDYEPQAEGHSGGEYWQFRGETTRGWEPMQPFYNTLLMWRHGKTPQYQQRIYDTISKLWKAKLVELLPTNRIDIDIKG